MGWRRFYFVVGLYLGCLLLKFCYQWIARSIDVSHEIAAGFVHSFLLLLIWPLREKKSSRQYRARIDALGLAVFVFWIPYVEEMLFRGMLSPFLRSQVGSRFGTYLSIFVFSFLHAQNPFELAIGPLLLATGNELLCLLSRRLYPAILCHAGANLIVMLGQ